MTDPVVICGGGLAAAKAAEALREQGYQGPVVMYAAEPHLPYERPPLSKDYLLGRAELDAAQVHDASWYDTHDVDLRVGSEVVGLDLATHRVRVAGGGEQPFHRLLLATGSAPRRLSMVEESGAPMTYLRTREDSTRIKQMLTPGRRVVVIGGGWIGLEVASAARAADAEVTVVESLELPLLRVLGPEVARIFADLHVRHGVDLRLGATVVDVRRDGEGAVVVLGDGSSVAADLVVVGIGVRPEDGLASAAGLATGDGVHVDEHMRTSHPDVLAAGDVASAFHPVLGRRVRVEHWDNAIAQGQVAGRNLAGESAVHDKMPYFFTDQYDLGMEYVGAVGPEGHDQVVLRGDTGDKGGDQVFTAFWLLHGKVLAGMQVNDWDATDVIRGLVGRRVDAAALGDPRTALADLAVGAG